MEKILQNGTKGLLDSFTATQQNSSSFSKPIQGFSTLHRQQSLEWRCRRTINAHSKGSSNFTKSLGQSAHFDEDVVWKGEAGAIRSSWALRADILGQLRPRSQVECSASTSAGGAFEGYCEAENIQPHGVGNGIIKDIQRRFPHYASDFTDGLHPKAASAILYMTFSSLAPCFAFGGMVARLTAHNMGLLETILSCAVSGIIYTLLAGQPLILLGPTGFMVVITGALYRVTTQAMVPFLPVYGWVGIWSCLFLLVLAAMEASTELVKYLTRFVDETFTTFISFGFMCEAYKGVAHLYKPASPYPIESALLSFLLAAGTYTVAKIFTQFRASRLLLRPVGGLLADFGPPLAICIMSMVPIRFFPTIPLPAMPAATTLATTGGRPWLVPLFSIPPWAIFASAVPAVFVALLIFLDQNMTGRLVNNFKSPPLQKTEGYNLDLAVVGVITGLMSLFGLPWMVASAVPSLNHVRSLIVPETRIKTSGDNDTKKEVKTTRILENRLTGVMISMGVAASLAFWSTLRLVPLPVTSGLFVFMSLSIINGNQFVERMKLWLYHPDVAPEHDFTKNVPKSEVQKFTALQLGCLWALWSLKESKWGVAFPVLILALVPIRNIVVARLFPPQHLSVLDPQ